MGNAPPEAGQIIIGQEDRLCLIARGGPSRARAAQGPLGTSDVEDKTGRHCGRGN